MDEDRRQPGPAPAPPGTESPQAVELAALRLINWRQRHTIDSLEDTIRVLRTGANALALDNVELRAEVAALSADEHRVAGPGTPAPRGFQPHAPRVSRLVSRGGSHRPTAANGFSRRCR